MANRYEQLFARLSQEGRKAFIPYTMLGFPNSQISYESIETMIKNGASALELGLAFSDPLADGAVIQQAAAETIESGFKMKHAFELVEKVRKLDSMIPISLMCYYNSVLALGLETFCARAAKAGVDGLLVVDLPPEQARELGKYCQASGLVEVFIISPLTTDERLQTIAAQAGGFLYAVSRLGTTGVEERYDEHLAALIKRARTLAKLPVAVGFGVSTPEQAVKMYELGAEAVITGSRIIELVRDEYRGKENKGALARFISSMAGASEALRAK